MDRVRNFRSLVGRFTTGVAVVGAWDGSQMRAVTVNSFTSLSLEPMMVLFCLQPDSRTYRLIRECGKFTVSILHEDQRIVSDHFAGRRSSNAEEHLEGEDGYAWVRDANAVFKCTHADSFPGGDHVIVTGTVEDELGPVVSNTPLVFHEGAYSVLQSDK